MRVDFTGQILVSESASKSNHIARAIDAVLSTPTGYYHTQVQLVATSGTATITTGLTTCLMVYVRAVSVVDGVTPAQITATLKGEAIKAQEIVLFNTDITTIVLDNANAFAVLVEVAAAGV
jgi:hypothetical protein